MSGVSGAHLAGGNLRGDRRDDDFYPTPCACTVALILAEQDRWRALGGRICEPAAGEGHMVEPIRRAGFDVLAADKVDRGYPGCVVRSFYSWTAADWDGRLLVTNPPFCELRVRRARWIHHALSIGVQYMALLLPVQWDAADHCRRIFRDGWRPARKLVLTWRPDWTGGGSPTASMAWYIWDGVRAEHEPVALTYHPRPSGTSRFLAGMQVDDTAAARDLFGDPS